MDIKALFLFLFGLGNVPMTMSQPSFAAFLNSLGFGGGGGDMSFPGFSGLPGLPDMTSSAGSGSCPYQTHPNKFKFSQMVNNRLMTQDCAPGTMFDLSKCSCVNVPSAAPGGRPPLGSSSIPRLDAMSGPNLAQLLSMLQSFDTGAGSSLPAAMNFPPPQMPPQMSPQMPPQMPSPSNPRSLPGSVSTGLTLDLGSNTAGPRVTPLVEPSLLPDVIPPEVLMMLQQAQNARSGESGHSNGGFSTPAASAEPNTPPPDVRPEVNPVQDQSLPGQLPPAVLQMLQKASSPSTKRPIHGSGPGDGSPALPQSVLNHLNDTPPRAVNPGRVSHALDGNGISPHILEKMKQSLAKPEAKSQPPLPTLRPNALSSDIGNGIPPHVLEMMKQSVTKPEAKSAPPLPTPRPRALTTPRPTGITMPAAGFPTGGDPMAALLAQLQRQIAGATNSNLNPKAAANPFAAFMPHTQPSHSPPQPSLPTSGGAPDMAALMSLFGGGSGPSMGGGSDMLAALMGGSSGGMPGAAAGGPLNIAALTGSMGAAAPMDMTSFFNDQGQMGAGGGLAGLANINFIKLQELERKGVIDISDLTPAGLAAANAHFSG